MQTQLQHTAYYSWQKWLVLIWTNTQKRTRLTVAPPFFFHNERAGTVNKFWYYWSRRGDGSIGTGIPKGELQLKRGSTISPHICYRSDALPAIKPTVSDVNNNNNNKYIHKYEQEQPQLGDSWLGLTVQHNYTTCLKVYNLIWGWKWGQTVN